MSGNTQCCKAGDSGRLHGNEFNSGETSNSGNAGMSGSA